MPIYEICFKHDNTKHLVTIMKENKLNKLIHLFIIQQGTKI